MDWLLILDVASDGGALASTSLAMFFGYRAATFTITEEAAETDLRRQSDYAIYAVLVSAVAAASFGIALMSL